MKSSPVLLLLVGLVLSGALGSAASDDPPDAAEAYRIALERYRAGEFESAAALLESTQTHPALLGWCRLRQARIDDAERAFQRAAERDPRSSEPQTGLGYVALRRGGPAEAAARFERAIELGAGADAWKGLGHARTQRGDHRGARAAWREAVELAPDDAEARRLLDENLRRIVVERRPRPAVTPDTEVRVPVRGHRAMFEIRTDDGWQPFLVKGVNLGSALPGRYPAEFPDDETLYATWFDQMRELGVNAVRLYTLHPPSLYRSLDRHNRAHPGQRIRLIQGVWTELPPGHDYDEPSFDEGFRAEIRRVIDAVHGNLELPERPGHAHGRYDTDVSGHLLVWLLGREWEPFSVDDYNRASQGREEFVGRYLRTEGATPIEAWLASICDTAAAHESEYYGMQHPVGYTSWPTLDPLIHPTEATVEEELAIRRRVDDNPVDEIREYDNDLVQVDTKHMHATDHFPAGLYASYHAYPYYPEFMVLDGGFAETRDAEGVSRYLGYLRDLAEHHGDEPVLIAEFGVPTSRGIAHLQPEGQHHGGHDSRSQGEIDARLMRNIHEAGLAGGVLFAWMDEWFKRNWIVMNYESPIERNRLWLNRLDAEQNFGLIGAYPGADDWVVTLDGEDDDWSDVEPIYRKSRGVLREMKARADAAYLYLWLEVEPSREETLWVGVDTYDARRGSHRFPAPLDRPSAPGLEFMLQIRGKSDSRILVDRPYDLFSNRLRRPYRSKDNDAGDFVEIRVFTNRDRYGRDGTYYPARGYSRSPLRFGSTDPGNEPFDDIADWFRSDDGRRLEIRLPWGLINVTDPSSHQVVHETDNRKDRVQTATTEGFRFHVVASRVRRGRAVVVDSFPEGSNPGTGRFPLFVWDGWDEPDYRLEKKPSFEIYRRALEALPAGRSTAGDLTAPIDCGSCEAWNRPRDPVHVFGNTWYVGVAGLSSVLITSDEGHVLLDGALPQSATLIAESVRKAGFRPEDIRLIAVSHEHYDHVGGVAALQRLTGAEVVAGPIAARSLERGGPSEQDPQYALDGSYPAVREVREVADGQTLTVGPIRITAHHTPGHTPGSTTWSWRSCEGDRCLDVVYADSLNAVSAPGFRFSDDPSRVRRFRDSIRRVAEMPCDVVIAVHPSFTDLDVDPGGCRDYAAAAERRLELRLEEEAAGRK